MKIAILAVGSQGDVRPSAALGAGLAAAGHTVRLVTLGAFKSLADSCGLDFAEVKIDPYEFIRGDIGQSWMESSDKPYRLALGFSRAAGAVIAGLNDDALAASGAMRRSSTTYPCPFSGHTVAEALGIPGIPTSAAPYHPTRDFSSLFTPSLPLQGGVVNRLSGAAAFQILWQIFRSHMNKWRKSKTALRPLPVRSPLRSMARQGLPWLYGFSPSVIPMPPDWPAAAVICGYWFTAPDKTWSPPGDLVDFLRSGPPPIYVGFGSMVGSNPEETQLKVLDAVRRAGVRAVVASGWGGMQHAAMPDFVFPIESVPHEWLFPKIAAAVHHGGAGTTAATLRAGIPSVVVPYFYDQRFWGQRLQSLGVAPRPIQQKHLTSDDLADAIRCVVDSPEMSMRSPGYRRPHRQGERGGCCRRGGGPLPRGDDAPYHPVAETVRAGGGDPSQDFCVPAHQVSAFRAPRAESLRDYTGYAKRRDPRFPEPFGEPQHRALDVAVKVPCHGRAGIGGLPGTAFELVPYRRGDVARLEEGDADLPGPELHGKRWRCFFFACGAPVRCISSSSMHLHGVTKPELIVGFR